MISRYVINENILYDIHFEKKEELFEFISNKAYENGYITSSKEFYEGLIKREEQGVTELKPYVVLPHSRGDFVKRTFIYFIIIPNGTKYLNAKKDTAKLIILIGSSKENKDYLQILASLSRMISKENLVDKLLKSEVQEDAIYYIKECAGNIEKVEKSNYKYSIFLCLMNENDTDKIFPLMTESGISNVTIVDAEKTGSALSFLSLFSSFAKSCDRYTKIFTGLSEDNDSAQKLNSLLKTEGIDLNQPDKGFLYSVKLLECFGGVEEDVDF